jgi:hypothetical protein
MSPIMPKKELSSQSPSTSYYGKLVSARVSPNLGTNFELKSGGPSDKYEESLLILRDRIERVREDKERLEKIQELKELEETLKGKIMAIQRRLEGK